MAYVSIGGVDYPVVFETGDHVKVTELNELTEVTVDESYLYIVSGGLDFKIKASNLVVIPAGVLLRVKDEDKSANYNRTIPSNSKLESLDIFWVSGSVTFKVGTTSEGDEIVSETTLTSGSLFNSFDMPLENTTTFYVTIVGGEITLNFNYYANVK